MFAIIKTGGKQYLVKPGDKIKIEKIDAPQDKEVVFDNVLMVAGDKPEETLIGAPYVKEYRVRGKMIGQGKGEKVIVYKYKSKKRYHKKQGHRQYFSEIEILEITKGDAEKSIAKNILAKKGAVSKNSKIQAVKK